MSDLSKLEKVVQSLYHNEDLSEWEIIEITKNLQKFFALGAQYLQSAKKNQKRRVNTTQL